VELRRQVPGSVGPGSTDRPGPDTDVIRSCRATALGDCWTYGVVVATLSLSGSTYRTVIVVTCTEMLAHIVQAPILAVF